MITGSRYFGGLAVFLVVAAAVYWFTSYEDAGTVLLALAGVMGLITSGYVLAATRGLPRAAVEEGGPAPEGAYLPHASVWPFWMGVGALLMVNGLAVGLWSFLPGAIAMAASLFGYARQSRRRD